MTAEALQTTAAKLLRDYADLLELLGRELHAGAERKFHRGYTVAEIRQHADELAAALAAVREAEDAKNASSTEQK